MEVCTRGERETRALGEAIGALAAPGDVIVLAGDLGAGKTVVAKGIAAGLGVTEPVVSPTFTIVREYEGRCPVRHLDVYRLDSLQELMEIGLDELIDDRGVTLVEWGDAVGALLPADRLEVRLEVLPPEEADDETRVVTICGLGPRWLARSAALAAAVAPFGGR
ncbi:MAG: tRNA (adenosine(37)-N6)-threonylcarbamoyltransferase complex ATPase subunit type 1 TsaE [Actinobacteria bacterium]|nr:tRNA (adenosine(37)-N6)-threonylcarbamoyltransferase complex ATPase subunit type 1 TsaE [Actinomycetota bacterium]